jgi:hypothetical protein
MNKIPVECDLHILGEGVGLPTFWRNVWDQLPNSISSPFKDIKSIEGVQDKNVAVAVDLDIN